MPAYKNCTTFQCITPKITADSTIAGTLPHSRDSLLSTTPRYKSSSASGIIRQEPSSSNTTPPAKNA